MPGIRLVCIICNNGYGIQDLNSGILSLDTMVCGYCYLGMQEQPYHLSCFGKQTIISEAGHKVHLGFSKKSEECTRWCLDRKVCLAVITNPRRAKRGKSTNRSINTNNPTT